jgi:hypothetical protein
MEVPNLVSVVGTKYNDAFVLIELNDTGQQVADILHEELEYENIIRTTVKGKKGQRVGEGFGAMGRTQQGVKMSTQIKKTGCLVIKEMVESDKLLITDFDTISELSTYIASGANYEASEGHNDDIVASLVLFGWLTTQSYFTEIVNTEVRQRLFEQKLKRLEEELVPFGFMETQVAEDEMSADAMELSRETPVKARAKTVEDFQDW